METTQKSTSAPPITPLDLRYKIPSRYRDAEMGECAGKRPLPLVIQIYIHCVRGTGPRGGGEASRAWPSPWPVKI